MSIATKGMRDPLSMWNVEFCASIHKNKHSRIFHWIWRPGFEFRIFVCEVFCHVRCDSSICGM